MQVHDDTTQRGLDTSLLIHVSAILSPFCEELVFSCLSFMFWDILDIYFSTFIVLMFVDAF